MKRGTFPAPYGDTAYEVTAKSEQLGDVWTCAAGLAQVAWYVSHFTRHGYQDIAVKVWRGHSDE